VCLDITFLITFLNGASLFYYGYCFVNYNYFEFYVYFFLVVNNSVVSIGIIAKTLLIVSALTLFITL